MDQSFVSVGLHGTDRCPVEIPDDGWIRTIDGSLLLYVPREHRLSICGDMSKLRIGQDRDGKKIRVDWDRLKHGEDWTSIRDVS